MITTGLDAPSQLVQVLQVVLRPPSNEAGHTIAPFGIASDDFLT